MRVNPVVDLLRDVLVEMHTRRARTVLLAAAIALATGALVASLSISQLAAAQIDTDLAATATRTVMVTRAGAGGEAAEPTFPEGATEAVRALAMVEAAGLRCDQTSATGVVIRADDPVSGTEVTGLTVAGATSGYPASVGASATATSWLLDGDAPVALLGPQAAAELDVPVSADPTGHGVWINGVRFQVVGFLRGTPVVDSLVLLPYRRVVGELGTDGQAAMTVLTAPGGSGPVADVVRQTIRPEAPAALRTSVSVDATAVRHGVATQLDRLTAGIGVMLLTLTMLLIANSMIVSVMSRTAEIGLRRAMGATRRGIAGLVLSEAVITGLVGGLSGSGVAAVIVVATALVNGWSAAMNPAVLLLAPAVGMVVAALAGVYPAVRAAAVQPAIAVRSD